MAMRTGTSNHLQIVHRPGEAALAHKVLQLLGCEPVNLASNFGGVTWQSSRDQHLWLSEVQPEQWSFEQWMQRQMQADTANDAGPYVEKARAIPQLFSHFGVGVETLDEWEAIIARVEAAAASDPELAGRVSLRAVFRPSDEGSVAKDSGGKQGGGLYQAFVHTDILASGLLTLGQAIEIQHDRDNDPVYRREHGLAAA